MTNSTLKRFTVLSSLVLLAVQVFICRAEITGRADIDNAINSYERGEYETAEKYVDAIFSRDKADFGAVVWNALIKMEKADIYMKSDEKARRAVAKRQYDVLGYFWWNSRLSLNNELLYSYYYAAYAKAYWLNDRPGKAHWYINEALGMHPKNYEALHVKGRIALDRVGEDRLLLTQDPGAELSVNSDLTLALKSFSAELEAAGNAPEIGSRAAYWAGLASYQLNGATTKTREFLELSVRSNPNGVHGALAKKMLEQKFNVR